MHFKYGLLDLWEFFCELLEISEEKNSVNYPITVYRLGKVPLKAPSKNGGSTTTKKQQSNIMMDDFDLLDEEDFSSEFEDGYDEEDDFSNDYYDEGVDEEDDYN